MLKTVWLEDLLVLAQTRHFARAAELRNVTQPGLSRRIQALEDWALTPLVDRQSVPLQLTPAGQALAEVAADVIARLGEVRQRLRPAQATQRPLVRIAAPHLLSISFFPRWLPQMRQRLDGLDLSVQSHNLQRSLELLAAGGADLVVCLLDPARETLQRLPASLRPAPEAMRTLGRDRLLALSSPRPAGGPAHRLGAACAAVLDYSEDCSLQWTLELARRAWPLQQLECRGRNQYSDGLRLMALGGMGLAWLPESTTVLDRAQGLLVPAGAPHFNVDLEILALRPARALTRATQRLWDALSEPTASAPPTAAGLLMA